jgi:hypothetical protein
MQHLEVSCAVRHIYIYIYIYIYMSVGGKRATHICISIYAKVCPIVPTNLASYLEVPGSPTGHCDLGLSWFASAHLSTSRTENYRTIFFQIPANSRGLAGKSPASHRRGQGSILGVSVWDLWWTVCQRDSFCYECVCFSLSLSLYGAPHLLVHLSPTIWHDLSNGQVVN